MEHSATHHPVVGSTVHESPVPDPRARIFDSLAAERWFVPAPFERKYRLPHLSVGKMLVADSWMMVMVMATAMTKFAEQSILPEMLAPMLALKLGTMLGPILLLLLLLFLSYR